MPDPDLEIRGRGGVIQTLRQEGGGRSPKKSFLALLRASFWSKNKGGGAPQGASHRSATIS